MAIKDLIDHNIQHYQLGYGVKFGKLITVGVGGNISNLADVAALATEPELLVTYTGSTVTEDSGAIFQILPDTASAIPGGGVGYHWGVRLGGSGNPILKCVQLNTTGGVKCINPLFASHTSVQVDIYKLHQNGVFILPNTEIVVASTVSNLPSFTTLFAIPGTSKIVSNISQVMVALGDDTNEINFFGTRFGFNNSGNQSIPIRMPIGELQYTCNNTFDTIDLETRGDDGIYYSGNIGSNLTVKNSKLVGYYDTIRCAQHANTNIINNEFHVWINGYTADSAAIAYGASAAIVMPQERAFISGNNVVVDSLGVGYGATVGVTGIEIRNPVSSAAVINIVNNSIKCEAHTADLVDVACINVSATGVATPKINVLGNILEARAAAGYTGTVHTIRNTNVNYAVNSANNFAVAGANSTNVTDISASLI